MSLHTKPLTNTEREGLRLHGLAVGTPSQVSDAFRHGVAYAFQVCESLLQEGIAMMDQNYEHTEVDGVRWFAQPEVASAYNALVAIAAAFRKLRTSDTAATP